MQQMAPRGRHPAHRAGYSPEHNKGAFCETELEMSTVAPWVGLQISGDDKQSR